MTQKKLQDFYVNIHEYKICELIGTGTSANVYRALNIKKNEIVALKIFKQNFQDDVSKTQFVREIETMAVFNHPAILSLKGYSIPYPGTNEMPSIATELMPNGSFLDILMKESSHLAPPGWNATKKLEAAFAVACGMMFIHNHNGIHRDLKPANILLDSSYEARISDFGLSKIQNSDSMQSLIAGTPLWMAPELFEQVQYTNKVDVFAYAIILYQVCTGHIPYDGKKNPMQIAMFISSGERPDIPMSVPYFYAKLITDCWEQDPNDRPTFDDIVYRMANTDTILSGVDFDQYKDYQKRLVNVYPPHPTQKAVKTSQFVPDQNQIQQMAATETDDKIPPNPYSPPLSPQTNSNQNPSNSPNHGKVYEPVALGSHSHKHHHKSKKSKIKEQIEEGNVNAMYEYGLKLINKGRENKAAKYIITAANRNQPDSLPIAARMYEEGKVVNQNLTYAAVYWKNAADFGNVEAMFKCGQILEKGIGVNQNLQKAFSYYMMAAGKNNIDAMLAAGRILSLDSNRKQDALNLFMQAANLGNLDAYYEYGVLVEPQDKERAVKCFEIAARKGHQKSIDKLDSIKKLEQQPSSGHELAILGKSSYEQSSDNSQNDLTIFHQTNHQSSSILQPTPQVPASQPCHEVNQLQATPRQKFKDQFDAIRQSGNCEMHKQASNINLAAPQSSPQVFHHSHSADLIQQVDQLNPSSPIAQSNQAFVFTPELLALKSAADLGHPESCYKLGCMLMDNPNSKVVELQNAAVYLRKAASAGSVDAQYRCGVILERGLGYPSNPQKAVFFYKQAADNGNAEAIYRLAMCLATGVGVPMKDPENANNYFRVAADLGHLQSQVNLAYNYDNGIGIKNGIPNSQLALHYYKLAAAQNNATALSNLGFMAQEGRGMPGNAPNLQMAAECYRKAAMLNDPVGMYNYAVILQNGLGVDKNISEAAKFYKLAADAGSVEAQSNYAILLSGPPDIGPGVQKDMEGAKKYAKMAADQGNSTGQCIYAQLVMIVDNNKEEALKYLKMSADQGNTKAQRKLKELSAQ